jgi:hypothetical protein
MLTRLRVRGFKNRVDLDIRFGCILADQGGSG